MNTAKRIFPPERSCRRKDNRVMKYIQYIQVVILLSYMRKRVHRVVLYPVLSLHLPHTKVNHRNKIRNIPLSKSLLNATSKGTMLKSHHSLMRKETYLFFPWLSLHRAFWLRIFEHFPGIGVSLRL